MLLPCPISARRIRYGPRFSAPKKIAEPIFWRDHAGLVGLLAVANFDIVFIWPHATVGCPAPLAGLGARSTIYTLYDQ